MTFWGNNYIFSAAARSERQAHFAEFYKHIFLSWEKTPSNWLSL